MNKDNNKIQDRNDQNNPLRQNWMPVMGILFIVMAAIIALRNYYFITTQLSFGFYLDNYTNSEINNEKFVIAMTIGGILLLIGGYYSNKKRRRDDRFTSYKDDLR